MCVCLRARARDLLGPEQQKIKNGEVQTSITIINHLSGVLAPGSVQALFGRDGSVNKSARLNGPCQHLPQAPACTHSDFQSLKGTYHLETAHFTEEETEAHGGAESC